MIEEKIPQEQLDRRVEHSLIMKAIPVLGLLLNASPENRADVMNQAYEKLTAGKNQEEIDDLRNACLVFSLKLGGEEAQKQFKETVLDNIDLSQIKED